MSDFVEIKELVGAKAPLEIAEIKLLTYLKYNKNDVRAHELRDKFTDILNTLNNLIKDRIPKTPYGSCPICGAKGVIRERRPNGNDKCENGHTYASREAINAG